MIGQISDNFWPELIQCKSLKRGEYLYYFAHNFNALCKIDLKNGEMDVKAGILKEFFDEKSLVTGLLDYGNEVVCIPFSAKQIHIIDLDNVRENCQIRPHGEDLLPGTYYNSYLQDRYCYLFPFNGHEITKLDMEKKEIVGMINVKEKYRSFLGDDYAHFSYSGCYAYANKLYMVMHAKAIIVEFDLCSMEICFHKLEGASRHYVLLTGNEYYIYILGKDGKMYIWDIKRQKAENILQLDLKKGKAKYFRYSAKQGKYIYLFKFMPSTEYIRIDGETNQIEPHLFTELPGLAEMGDAALSYMAMEDGKFYFMSVQHEIYIINFEQKVVEKIPLEINRGKLRASYMQIEQCEMTEKLEELLLEGKCIWML